MKITRDEARDAIRMYTANRIPTRPTHALMLYETAGWPIPKHLLWIKEQQEREAETLRKTMKSMGYTVWGGSVS